MLAGSHRDEPEEDGAIRAVVMRLARPDREGGAVIERAAIIAEGANAVAIEKWVLAHGGHPEAPLANGSRSGLYGTSRREGRSTGTRAPRRYVLPVEALA